jgi:LDH2 family malate/lactate/ureidoglycolate dehydrogenase
MNDQIVTTEATVLIGENELTDYAARVFVAAGLSHEHALIVARNLVLADLRGIESHGVTRVPIYGERIQRKVVNASPLPRAESVGPSIVRVDGDNGPGAVVGHFALGQAIDRAKTTGIGVALARNSNHFGICADYALRAASAGYVAMVATNSPTSMAVWGAGEPYLGTNPFAFAAPVGGRPPIMLDFASSVVARGKIVEKAKRGEPIPEGWALTRDGRPTTDAKEAEAGIVLPFAGPKGSGIAIMVEVLCGVLTGAAIGAELGNLYRDFTNPQNTGHFFLVLDPARALGAGIFEARAHALAGAVGALRPASGFAEVLLPGEPEQRLTDARRKNGIPVLRTTIHMLDDYARQFGIAFPV